MSFDRRPRPRQALHEQRGRQRRLLPRCSHQSHRRRQLRPRQRPRLPRHLRPRPARAGSTSKPGGRPAVGGHFDLVVASFRTESRAAAIGASVAALNLPRPSARVGWMATGDRRSIHVARRGRIRPRTPRSRRTHRFTNRSDRTIAPYLFALRICVANRSTYSDTFDHAGRVRSGRAIGASTTTQIVIAILAVGLLLFRAQLAIAGLIPELIVDRGPDDLDPYCVAERTGEPSSSPLPPAGEGPG